MKTKKSRLSIIAAFAVVVIASCTAPITLTTWKNPADNTKLKKIVVMPLFDKLENIKPFEASICGFFNSKGLKSIGSLEFLNPSIKYPIEEIKKKCDSLGADAILVFVYKGTDKEQTYVPATTYVSAGYGGYWGGGYWGGGYYGGTVTTTGGYWSTTQVVNLEATVYTRVSKKEGLWTAAITVTDPQYIDQVGMNMAKMIYADWQKCNLVVAPVK